MAKYFIEDTTLKSMADTIRSLTGSTAPLTPSEMTAGVQDAKEDVDGAIAALEALGVEIPEGSDIGDLAGLVGEVESGTDTSDATAVASDIMLDKTAYGSDGKLTGTFTLDSEIGTQENLIATIKETLATKALPDSDGGGGSVETAALTFLTPVSGAGEPFGGVYVSYIDETYTLQQPLVNQNVPITFYPIKNSIVFMNGAEVGNRTLGWLYSQGQIHCFVIGEDMSIQLLDL